MAKSFNTNVAAAWISTDISAANQQEEKTTASSEEKEERKETVAKKSQAVKKEKPAETAEPKKKVEKQAAFTITPEKELKSRQTSILLKQSIYEKLDVLAKKNNISINSCINQILEQVLQ